MFIGGKWHWPKMDSSEDWGNYSGGLEITKSNYFIKFHDAFIFFSLPLYSDNWDWVFKTLALGHFSSSCMLVQKRNFTKYCEILQYLITILENPLIIVQHYEEEAEKGAALHVMQDPQACKEIIKREEWLSKFLGGQSGGTFKCRGPPSFIHSHNTP